jgi:anti-sigma factor RsiW
MMSRGVSQHLDEGTLGVYTLGDLPACQAEKVKMHLANCAFCRADLRQMEELVVALRSLTLTQTVARRQWAT